MARVMTKYPVIIGLDPAIRNFGYAVLHMDHDGSRYKLLEAGHIAKRITDFGDRFDDQISSYRTEIHGLLRRFNPKLLVAERFQTRQRLTFSMGEKVNLMLGIALYRRSNGVRLVAPGAWKKQANSRVLLKTMYNVGRKHVRTVCKEKGLSTRRSQIIQKQVPHCIDAACVALLYGARYLGYPFPTELITERLPIHVVSAIDF